MAIIDALLLYTEAYGGQRKEYVACFDASCTPSMIVSAHSALPETLLSVGEGMLKTSVRIFAYF